MTKKHLNIVKAAYLQAVVLGLSMLIIWSYESAIIKAIFGPVAIVCCVLLVSAIGAYSQLWFKKPKTFSHLQAQEGASEFSHSVNVDGITHHIDLEEFYSHLRLEASGYCLNRDKWEDFGYSRDEIRAMKNLLLTLGAASADGRGAVKLVVSPGAAIDMIKRGN